MAMSHAGRTNHRARRQCVSGQAEDPVIPTTLDISHHDTAHASLVALAHELSQLEGSLLDLEHVMGKAIARVAPERRDSAKNLVHYLALRQHDLRDLQVRLSQRGLSSLGRSESCVMGSLLEVSIRAHEALALRGDPGAKRELARLVRRRKTTLSWEAANAYLHQYTRDVLGPRPESRHIYVMVTAPSANEANLAWMERMLKAGMNVLRINCAHEGEREWTRMVEALSEAKTATGLECRILMDLAGPKIRTGPVGGRRIAKWKPTKDELGATVTPARVVLRASPIEDSGAFLRVTPESLAALRVGDELRFRDARGKKRALRVATVTHDAIGCESSKRAYVLDEADARHYRGDQRLGDVTLVVEGSGSTAIDVREGDALVLTTHGTQGSTPERARDGRIVVPGMVGCTLPAALDHLEVGHRVSFDDGRVQTVVVQVRKKRGEFLLRVARTQEVTTKLRAEKGINLPDTRTSLSCLTEADLRALRFVAKRADAVSLSFVRTPDDIRTLNAELDRLGRPDIGVVLKIETRAGFENLPQLLLEGLTRPPLAVMIARGDLAVEVGYERLAELQEEILWLCEASHVPAIWATQVLDTLARTGVPSRAEVTDAAASVAAECVMLNKGPFVDQAVAMLSDILQRMEKHHYKKRSLFRKLRVSTFAIE